MRSIPILVLLCLGTALHGEPSLRLTGSTTVESVLAPKEALLEKAIGSPIEFSGIGTVSGLLSLAADGADMAMLSSPLDEVARMIDEKTPGKIDISQFRAVHIGQVRTVFIVNPHNAVRHLTTAQLIDVLTGKIANWKDVGGADAPIVVVTLVKAGPLMGQLLHEKHITPAARAVSTAPEVPVLVAQNPNAIGIISAAHARGLTSLLETDANILSELYLVTKGEPTGARLKLIEAAKTLLHQGG